MIDHTRRRLYRKEKAFRTIAFISTLTSIVAVAVISLFIFSRGIPTISKIGIKDFVLGTKWSPIANPPKFGILPFIVSSFWVTLGAVILGVPTGIFTAVFMAKYCSKKMLPYFAAGVNLMAGIPSIIYGFFGLTVLVPAIGSLVGRNGLTMLAAIIVLAVMILPTVISLSYAAIGQVDPAYYEGAMALGATKERSIFTVVLPAARSGILSSVILGMGRAIGETMAVILVAGGQPRMPKGLLRGVRTLTMNIAMEMGYAEGLHRESLIATGAVLFVLILFTNVLFLLSKRKAHKE